VTESASHAILYPSFAMFALVAFVFVRMARLRFGAVRSGQVNPGFYKTYDAGEEPEALRVVTRHFINLFEVPVLFHVVALMAYVTHHAGWGMVALAWGYVALRFAHAREHLGRNDVLTRFRLYFASGIVLALMWAGLFVALVLEG
jgi:hypothetical protein